nr:MAG TPA: hypothetical protein [Caudoviricetes sp.]
MGIPSWTAGKIHRINQQVMHSIECKLQRLSPL